MRITFAFAVFVMCACSKSAASAPAAAKPPSQDLRPTPVAAASGTPSFIVGAPKVIGSLTVYPITSKTQFDPGPVVTLDAALRAGTAEVREVGATDVVAAPRLVPNRGDGNQSPHQARVLGGGGATVNTLVLENKGKSSVFVIAGTVVKGGNQDREIGQDFLVEPGKTVSVDAFCVEHGRWTAEREGNRTGGKFGATEIIATTKVRAAAQYKKNQGEVWDKVAEANASHKKTAETGTFMATLDDAAIVKKRTALATEIESFLSGVAPAQDLVGIAYAVDGRIRGARTFAHHTLYRIHQSKLAQSMALEALTDKADADASGKPTVAVPPPAPAAVDGWMKEAESAALETRSETAAANANEYRQSARAYSSKSMMKPKAAPAAAGAPTPPAPVLSSDYVAK